MNSLKEKVVVITGSTRGFGYAIARAMAAEGAQVVITGRSQEAVDRALNGIQPIGSVTGFVVDVREEAQVHILARDVVQKLGRIDVWINNAGYSSAAGMILDMNPREALDMFLSNDLGAMHGTQAALAHMLERKDGLLVNIYGNGSFLRPASPTALYGTTKAWLTSFTRSLATEIKGSGVRILGFSPGMMLTDMLTSPRVVGEKARQRLENFGFVLRFLGRSPEYAAAELVKAIRRQRGEFVEVKLFKPWTPMIGLLRVAWENVTKTGSTPEYTLKVEEGYRPKY
jgi:NAD(P)-dependent dehydrogenase (short-subunit alcohol dehydrogenase family)